MTGRGAPSVHLVTYRLHDTTGDDFGPLEHPAPNLELGDVIVIPDRRQALFTRRVET